MTKKNNDTETEEQVVRPEEPQGFSPAFAALLEHIGRMIAKDMIEKAKETPEAES